MIHFSYFHSMTHTLISPYSKPIILFTLTQSRSYKFFRQYINTNKIKIECKFKQKRFNVIEGNNGAGKTNIMNSIIWCFFGKGVQ